MPAASRHVVVAVMPVYMRGTPPCRLGTSSGNRRPRSERTDDNRMLDAGSPASGHPVTEKQRTGGRQSLCRHSLPYAMDATRGRRRMAHRATLCGAVFALLLVSVAEPTPSDLISETDRARAEVTALVERTLQVVLDIDQQLTAGGANRLSPRETDLAVRLLRDLREAVDRSDTAYRAGAYDRATRWARTALDLALRMQRSIDASLASRSGHPGAQESAI